MRALVIIPAMLLAACGPRVVTRETVKTVSVPVVQKCAAERPPQVIPIDSRYSAEQWELLSFKQKAEIVAAQGLTRLNYSAALEAATGAC